MYFHSPHPIHSTKYHSISVVTSNIPRFLEEWEVALHKVPLLTCILQKIFHHSLSGTSRWWIQELLKQTQCYKVSHTFKQNSMESIIGVLTSIVVN